MAFADKSLKCIECSQDFTYAATEQELHQSLGYQNVPKRCGTCREAKRQRKGDRPPRREDGAPASAEGGEARPAEPRPARPPAPARPPRPESRVDRPPGRGDRGPRVDRGPRRDGGDRREPRRDAGVDPGAVPREFFIAICAECGAEAQLPFKPRGDRPVFCGDCFEKKRAVPASATSPTVEPSLPPAPPPAAPEAPPPPVM